MNGRFTYKKNPTGWDVHYQGPFDESSKLLCTLVRQGRRWVVPNTSLGPFESRGCASYAHLQTTTGPVAKTLDFKVRCGWADLELRRHGDRTLTPEMAAAIYDILIAKCKAVDRDRDGFISAHTTGPHVCTEWRFGGLLGYGGKFWNGFSSLYVNCYLEDEGPETNLIIAETNEAIFNLYKAK